MKKRLHYIILGIVLPLVLVGCTSSNTDSDEKILRIYTTRVTTADSVINSTFTSKTGIKVEQIEVKDSELIDRLAQESDKTKADVIIFNGAEKISELKSKKLIQAHGAEKIIGEGINSEFYGAEWVGLTQRPRAFVTLKENTQEPATYEELASESYQKSVFMQATKSSENMGLVAGLYANDATNAEAFVAGIDKNVAIKSEESDFEQIRTLVNKNDVKGVAVVDVASVEKVRQSKNDAEKAMYEKIKVAYPKEVFTNISAMSISAYSKQKDNATQYMNYLLSRDVQNEYMLLLGEYPIRNDVTLLEGVAELPPLTRMQTDYDKLGDNKEKLNELFNKYHWE